jgi:uncharacterized protein YkwD
MAIRRTFSVNRTALGWTLLGLLAASAPLPGQPRTRGEREPPDPLPPPLIAPVIVPPGEEPELAPRAAPAITFEERVLELVNEERLANGGLPPLKGVAELNTSSGTHSFNMADRDFFAHCDVDTKRSPFQRMTEAGYLWNAAAENIAAGQTDPEDVMTGPFGWMNSAGHRANILSTSYREIGIGYFLQANDQGNVRVDGNGDCTADGIFTSPLFRYWTQNLGRRNSVYPVVIDREAHDTPSTTVNLYLYGQGWAEEMRFSTDGCTWSGWETFSSETPWVLDGGGGNRTILSQIRSGGTVLESSDSIVLEAPCDEPLTRDLSMTTIESCQVYEACDMVSAGDQFQVGSSGDVTFLAGDRIVLHDGFSVASGGVFRAVIDPAIP